MTAPGDPAPRAESGRSGLWRRLPLVIVAAIGLAVVLPAAPRDVEVDYVFHGEGQGASHLEIELRDDRGVGVRRTELALSPGRPSYTQHLRLARGTYRAVLTFTGDGGSERLSRDFTVANDEVVEVDLDVARGN